MTDREIFETSLKEWRRETQNLSWHKKDHPAYQRIIGLKERAIPLILDELQKRPSWILIALFDITGERPGLPQHAGRLQALTDDWLQWGRAKGYLPAK